MDQGLGFRVSSLGSGVVGIGFRIAQADALCPKAAIA